MARQNPGVFRKKFNRLMQRKLVTIYVAVVLAFVFLLGRVVYINAASGDKYAKIVLNQQQYDNRTIPFKRGDIVDRNGTTLATSERVYNVILDSQAVLSQERYLESTAWAVQECFGMDAKDVVSLIEENPDSRYLVLEKDVDYDTAQKFKEMDEDDEMYPDINGVWLEEDYIRSYPYDTLACDVIGFTSDGNVGSNGIESYYNSVLNGTDGREYGYLDSDSSYETTVKEPENGSTVVSTIDLQVQSVVEEKIKDFNDRMKNASHEGEGSANTAVIVMNPQNGEILAEASYPNYDLNNPQDLSAYYSESELADMSDEEWRDTLNSLWNNFCVSDTYEPGSTYKPFTIAAGLETGVLTGDESYYCGGSMTVGGEVIHCSNRSGHGQQTLKQSLEQSCNVALMQIGESLGAEAFCKYQSNFGLGQYTGIDLPGEATAEALLYTPENMRSSDLATNSFGQNFNVTMTQMVSAFSSLVNGGNYYRPHIVKEIQNENGNVTESKDAVLVRETVSEETSEILKDYMLGVVQEGTGTGAAVEGYDIGGKTGTAEKLPRGNGNYLVSFIGYAPQENPQVVIYVVIDEPNSGDQANSGYATNLASDIMEEILPYLGIQKSDGTEEGEEGAEAEDVVTEEENLTGTTEETMEENIENGTEEITGETTEEADQETTEESPGDLTIDTTEDTRSTPRIVVGETIGTGE